MIDLKITIIWHVNELNIPVKSKILKSKMQINIKIQLKCKDRYNKVNGWKKIYHINSNIRQPWWFINIRQSNDYYHW